METASETDGGSRPPAVLVSAPLARLSEEVLRATFFFSALFDILRSTDHLANAVAEVRLGEIGPEDPRRPAYANSLLRPDRRQDWFRAQQDLIVELLVVRVVDSFLTYIAQILAAAFRARPEMLRSEEQVRVDEVLRFDTMEELVGYLAERRVNRLAYKSLDELGDYLRRQLAFELFTSDEERARASAIVELRNLIVHNGRVANARYLARVPGSKGAIGTQVPVDAETLEEAVFLAEIASRIDEQAAAKWGLARDVAMPTDAPKGQPG